MAETKLRDNFNSHLQNEFFCVLSEVRDIEFEQTMFRFIKANCKKLCLEGQKTLVDTTGEGSSHGEKGGLLSNAHGGLSKFS